MPFSTRLRRFAGVTLVEAADENEEACAIAIALRETLEGRGTAALVTPDRELARRVREELTRWNIDIEESSGEPLGQTPAGALARLVLDCALKDLAPVEILALLHHPDLRLGRPRGEVIRLTRHLEFGVLRGVLPAQVLGDPEALLAAAQARRDLPHAHGTLRLIGAEDFAQMGHFLADLLGALKPLRDLPDTAPLPAWLAAHERVLADLARDETGDVSLTGADFSVLGALFEELDEAADPAILLDCPGYGALFDRLAAETPVRGPNRSHPRIKILGLLEARLLTADRMILGGLDETIWPPAARSDPFLNRPMRAALGLSPPERRIARTAHDFEMALGQEEVIVTRALKRGGAPTVPSRFLQRLGAVASEGLGGLPDARRPVHRLCARPRPSGDADDHPAPCPAPAGGAAAREAQRHPYRDLASRPLRDLCRAHPEAHAPGAPGGPDGPTRVRNELPRRDPRLQPYPCRPGAAAGCHGPSARPHPRGLLRAVRRSGVPHLPVAPHPQLVAGFPRLGGRAARATRSALRRGGRPAADPLADGSIFTLTATADRIELDRQGRATIVDFKTGATPSIKEVKVGFAPQLTLEADMVAQGAFTSLGRVAEVATAVYVKFGADDIAKRIALDWKGEPPFADVVAEHRDELVRLLNSFRSESTGYLARPFPKYASRFGTYDHLSRVKEWSATGGLDDGVVE